MDVAQPGSLNQRHTQEEQNNDFRDNELTQSQADRSHLLDYKIVNKVRFLTRRWNYIISLMQGVPTFAFVIYGLSTPVGETRTGMIVLSVLGALF